MIFGFTRGSSAKRGYTSDWRMAAYRAGVTAREQQERGVVHRGMQETTSLFEGMAEPQLDRALEFMGQTSPLLPGEEQYLGRGDYITSEQISGWLGTESGRAFLQLADPWEYKRVTQTREAPFLKMISEPVSLESTPFTGKKTTYGYPFAQALARPMRRL